jgi:hypothetical protein
MGSSDQGAPDVQGERQVTAPQVPSLPALRLAYPFEPLNIKSHVGLSANSREILRRFQANPDFIRLMFVNPVLAFQEVGVNLSADLQDHMLRAVRHSPAARAREEELVKSLGEALGEPPEPRNPQWLRRILFEKLKVEPLDTSGHKPTYRSWAGKFAGLTPTRQRYPQPRRVKSPQVRIPAVRPAARNLDLDAPVAPLGPGPMPDAVDLETLYFYRGAHPLVQPLLELGVLQLRTLPILTGERFRKIRDGESRSPLRTWIQNIRFIERSK